MVILTRAATGCLTSGVNGYRKTTGVDGCCLISGVVVVIFSGGVTGCLTSGVNVNLKPREWMVV
jgi:hypothetical protein